MVCDLSSLLFVVRRCAFAVFVLMCNSLLLDVIVRCSLLLCVGVVRCRLLVTG